MCRHPFGAAFRQAHAGQLSSINELRLESRASLFTATAGDWSCCGDKEKKNVVGAMSVKYKLLKSGHASSHGHVFTGNYFFGGGQTSTFTRLWTWLACCLCFFSSLPPPHPYHHGRHHLACLTKPTSLQGPILWLLHALNKLLLNAYCAPDSFSCIHFIKIY